MRQTRSSGGNRNKSRGGRGGKPAAKRSYSKKEGAGNRSARPFEKRESREDGPSRERKPFERREDTASPRFKRDDSSGERRSFKKDDRSTSSRTRSTGSRTPSSGRSGPSSGKFSPSGRPGGKKFGSGSDRNRTSDGRFSSRSDKRKGERNFGSSTDKRRTGEETPRSDRFKRDEGNSERPRFDRSRSEEGNSERPRFERSKNEGEKSERPAFKDRKYEKKDVSRVDGKRRRVGSDDKPFEKREDRPFRPASRTGSAGPYERRGTKRGEGREVKKDRRVFDKKQGGERSEAPWNRKEKHEFYGDRKKSKSFSNLEKANENDGTRLNKYISNAGICSRREADELIAAGVVSVNGEVVTEMGYKVNPGDVVKYNNETLRSEQLVYILLNKPKDFITTTDDPEDRKTVMSLISKACKERVYPVGRLDRNTTGILLFTNDGDLAKKLTHPSFMVHKVYQVELDRAVKNADMENILAGVQLEDGFIKPDEAVYTNTDKNVIGMELHSGKNRIVRRIFEHLGYEVKKLDRVVFAGLTKKDLPRGRWRFLTEMEVANLKMMTGKSKLKVKS